MNPFSKPIFSLGAAALALSLASPVVQAQSATYVIEPTHTFVHFEQKHFGISSNRGRWEKKEGSITLDRAAKTGRAEISLDMTSISTGVAPFDGHLKSADFFDVANHPKATFVGTDFKFDGDKVTEVSGQLTMRGKTNPLTLRASSFGCFNHPRLQREVCGGDFEGVVKRSLWDVSYGVANRAIPDDTKITIQIEAIKQ
jgi:polyisoprenoid-binding protein YceI